MGSFSDLLKSRYSAVSDPTLLSNIFPAAAALREEISAAVSASSRVTIDGDILAMLDAIVAASAQDVVESAIELLRTDASAALPSTGRENYATANVGTTVVVAATSVTFTAPSPVPPAGAWPSGTRRFSALRTAIRLTQFATDDKKATQTFTVAL